MNYTFDQFQVDTAAFEVMYRNERLAAQPQVVELLVLLLGHQDRVVSRDEIFEHIWKDRVVSDAALSSRIKTLRQLLGDDGETQKYVRTIHGRGFRFVGEAKSNGSPTQPVDDKSHVPPIEKPQTKYAKSGDIHIAYQVYGNGPVNMVVAPGFVSHIDNYWDSPEMALWLTSLGRHATVALFDKRGTGLSDSVNTLPGMDERMDDVRVVMDAAGWERAFIMGISEGGSLAALFAATYPQRSLGLILYGSFAKFTSWFPTDEALQGLFDYIETSWGTGVSLPLFAPSRGDSPEHIEWWGKFERLGATPGAARALMTMNRDIDISGILPTIQVPAIVIHPVEDVLIDFEGGQYLADNIPNCKLVEIPGKDHLVWYGDYAEEVTHAIAEFISGEAMTAIPDTVLTTVLSVNVRNTDQREGATPEDWRNAALEAVGHRFSRFRGSEIAPREECQLATFDGPARAMHCALDIIESLSSNRLSAAIGVHTGEVSLADGGVAGPTLDMALRISRIASDDQVLVTRTVKELAAGSGLRLEPFEAGDENLDADARSVFRVERE